MSYKPLDDRQITNRAILGQLSPYVSNQTLDNLLASTNNDLTVPLNVTASNPASLVINVGPAIVNNSVSNRSKSISFINTSIPSFTGCTVTFPSASGGNITTSQGGSTALTLPSGNFVQVLLTLDATGKVDVNIGTPASTSSAATVPYSAGTAEPFAYVTLSNVGGVIQNVTQSNIYQLVGNGSSSGGSGSGSKNYLTTYTASTSSGVPNVGNGNFEAGNTSGFSLAHSALSGVLPTSVATAGSAFSSSSGGSSASGNLSLGVVSSGQLSGAYSASLVSSVASTAGDMIISSPFFIDKEDQAKVMTIKMYYSPNSGASNLNFSGTSSNSFAVWIYDVTNGAWIMPAGVYNFVQETGSGYVTGTFQTTPNSTQYQIAIININASSGAYTMYFDDLFVGPQTAPIGAAMTDWVLYTPTFTGLGTPASSSVFYKRVGDTIMVEGSVVAGTSSSSINFSVSLPSGLSIDFTKIQTTATSSLGYVTAISQTSATDVYASTSYGPFPLFSDGSTTNLIFAANSTASGGYTKISGNSVVSPGNTASFTFSVPIAGWSSNTSVSNDTDTRVVAASATNSSAQTTLSTIVNWTLTDDTHGAFNTTTGVYTIPVTGWYDINFVVPGFGAGNTSYSYAHIVANGTTYSGPVNSTNTLTGWSGSAYALVYLLTGQTITFNFQIQSETSYTPSGAYMSISRRSGPAVVAATESVNATYENSNSSSIGTSDTQIIFNSKQFDSHNAYSTSTGNYTIPVSGKYFIAAKVTTNAITWTANNQLFELKVYQNGSLSSVIGEFIAQTAASFSASIGGSVIISCNAGDTLSLYGSSSVTGTLNGVGNRNYFSISRVGN